MTTVSDYIFKFVESQGVKDVFLFTGGGAMFLDDALYRNKKLNKVCLHHEQAVAMAAVAYSKYTRNLGVAVVTTGCGVTNTLTGLLDAYQDSVPCLFISGQVKLSETVTNSNLALRQFGVQEVDVVPLVKNLTKYAIMVTEPHAIAYHLEKAVYLAKSGRPAPVWLDIPMNVQGAEIDEKELIHFYAEFMPVSKEAPTEAEISKVRELLLKASRPIVIAGQGIALSGATKEFERFIEHENIPFVVSGLGLGVLPTNHPLFVGRIGNKGDRAGNFAMQNSDLVIAIGSRLSVSSLGQNYEAFAREAKVVVIDIDPTEHQKKTIRIDLFINADAKKFFEQYKTRGWFQFSQKWVGKCQEWKAKWATFKPEYAKEKKINLYHFVNTLSEIMPKDAVVVSDAGSAFFVPHQALQLKRGQRYIPTGGQLDMGFTLPASIGASIAKRGEVIGITGDGSFQLNIQELQSIVHYKLPIKLFVWNNNGYLTIRNTQKRFFEGRFIGTDCSCGISFPSVRKIANAYGIRYFKLQDSRNLKRDMKKVLDYQGAVVCEVMCNPNQQIVPCVVSVRKEDGTMVSKPLEDMFPFLDRKEFLKEMIVKPLEVE
jgi:acetolactate synthase-1/2/3 large subunit